MYEPLSARCYKEGLKFEKVINAIFFDKNHCRNAYINTVNDIKQNLKRRNEI